MDSHKFYAISTSLVIRLQSLYSKPILINYCPWNRKTHTQYLKLFRVIINYKDCHLLFNFIVKQYSYLCGTFWLEKIDQYEMWSFQSKNNFSFFFLIFCLFVCFVLFLHYFCFVFTLKIVWIIDEGVLSQEMLHIFTVTPKTKTSL